MGGKEAPVLSMEPYRSRKAAGLQQKLFVQFAYKTHIVSLYKVLFSNTFSEKGHYMLSPSPNH